MRYICLVSDLFMFISAIDGAHACTSGEERGPVLEVIVARMNYMRAALARQRSSGETTLVSSARTVELFEDPTLLCSIIRALSVCRQHLRMQAIWRHG